MNTQDKLVDKTITVIDKYGYQNLSLRKLTATLGLTTGAFYKHFKSKDALYEKVAIELSRNFIDKISLPDNATAQEKLLIIAKNFCQYVDQHNNLAEFLFFNSTTLKVFSTKKSKYDFLDKMKVLVNELNPKKNVSNQDLFIQIWSFIQGYAALVNKKIVEYDEDLVKRTLDEFLQ
ncbi:TetR/AcrR family transcriptional regulator [Lactobacillus gasseri]|uniref:TetR/AcrR family transcriptional regulator n=1 Tax=Lactobacillus gasseri TaxID=1596 RepID=UPI000277005C|nr:TetR/AcrR family transcriptional regulator [Lactobacillus gasseri]EJN54457.1 Transcriptional regulator [Lactobacillus gasseri CECT 5714]MBV6740281.1 TetR/AcrR family transcriptional regulator [Lactobacillus gasseri CECT 5714]WEA88639.1 TetR/AcrR family transcriptional regulator [Lactobacillus gasseri]